MSAGLRAGFGVAGAVLLATAAIFGAGVPAAAQAPLSAGLVAPSGTLRAAINLGNPVLAGRDAQGTPAGVTVDIARELGRRMGVPVSLVVYTQAGQVADAAGENAWDVAFLAIEPKRAEEIAFTAPYVLIEGAYAVPADSPLQAVADVARPGTRIAVIAKSAYDLFLTRTLKYAALVRGADDAATTALFRDQHLDALAGVRQPLARTVAQDKGLRLLPGRFMAIEQAMGVPRAHAAALPALAAFMEEIKASGFVAAALARHGHADVTVAPAAP